MLNVCAFACRKSTVVWCLHTADAHSGAGAISSLQFSRHQGSFLVNRGKGRATLSLCQLAPTPLNLTIVIDILGGVFPNSDVPVSPTWFQYSDIHHVVYELCLKNDNRKSLSWRAGLTLASVFKARIRTCDLHSQAPAFPEAKETDPRLSSLTHFQDKSSVPEIDGTLVGMLLASYPSASNKHYYPK